MNLRILSSIEKGCRNAESKSEAVPEALTDGSRLGVSKNPCKQLTANRGRRLAGYLRAPGRDPTLIVCFDHRTPLQLPGIRAKITRRFVEIPMSIDLGRRFFKSLEMSTRGLGKPGRTFRSEALCSSAADGGLIHDQSSFSFDSSIAVSRTRRSSSGTSSPVILRHSASRVSLPRTL